MAAGPHRLGLTPRTGAAHAAPRRLVALGARSGHRGQPHDQPGAAAARARRAGDGRRQPSQRGAVGPGLQVLPVPGAHRRRDPGGLPVGLRRRHRRGDDARALHAARTSRCRRGRPASSSVARSRWRARSPPSTTACGSARSCAASARPTRWPTRSGPCASCPAPSTSSAWPSSSRSASRRSWSRASNGSAGPASSAAAPTAGSTRCAASPSPCSRTPSSARCGWPRPWTRAATAAPARPRRGSPAAHRCPHARPACSASASAPTGCSTAPTPGSSGCPALLGRVRAVRRRSRRSAAAGSGAPSTGPTPGGCPSGSSSPAGVVPAVVFIAGRRRRRSLNPSTDPLVWPTLAGRPGAWPSWSPPWPRWPRRRRCDRPAGAEPPRPATSARQPPTPGPPDAGPPVEVPA